MSTRKSTAAKQSDAASVQPPTTGAEFVQHLKDLALEQERESAKRSARLQRAHKTPAARGARKVGEASEILESLHRLTVLTLDAEPDDGGFSALAIATHNLTLLAMHRLEQASATLTDGQYHPSEYVNDWIGPLAERSPPKTSEERTEAKAT